MLSVPQALASSNATEGIPAFQFEASSNVYDPPQPGVSTVTRLTFVPDPQARQSAISSLPAYLPGRPRELSGQAKARQALLDRNEETWNTWAHDSASSYICNVRFDDLVQRNIPVDIMSSATPKRYRLLDCTEAVHNQNLRIHEFLEFPRVQYAALSYVWRGNHPVSSLGPSIQEFSVLGAEDADPIGLDVLVDTCAAALACGASHLWLDRLCIMQKSKQDKQWQIREMYRVYTFSTVCIVAPAGLRFLVPLDEETQWIHRGWTLQEVVAPPSAAVLFAWTHGAGETTAHYMDETLYGRIEVVTPGRSAMASLGQVLDWCIAGRLDFTPVDADDSTPSTYPILTEAALFGKLPDDGSICASPQERISLPNISALSFAIARNLDTEEMRDFCIWQCALVRTSSRPVDMIFSVMGILGVILDPAEFSGDDRIGATIALAQEILRQGRSASWLGMHIAAPPSSYISTFPAFPRTSVAGKPLYDMPGGGEEPVALSEAVYPNEIGVFPPLKGSMDDAGYLSFEACAIRVTAVAAPERNTSFDEALYDDPVCPALLRAIDGSKWAVLDNVDSSDSSISEGPRSFAVMLGWYNDMPAGATGDNIRAMLVTEHGKDLYHVRSYFVLSHKATTWASTREVHHFCIGGPEKYAGLNAGT